MKVIPLALGLLVAFAATTGQAADKVYKWKDANGIVHFSDAPPPKGTEFDNVKIVGKDTPVTQSEPEATTDTPAVARDGDSKAARCEAARDRVKLLSSSMQLTVQRDGKTVPLEDADRTAELAIAKTTVDSLCTPEANG